MTIIILEGRSNNRVLNKFSHDLLNGFRLNNIDSQVINITNPNDIENALLSIQHDVVKAVISFNSLLGKVDEFIKNLPIPYISWMVDAPWYHYDRLKHISKNRINLLPNNKILISCTR